MIGPLLLVIGAYLLNYDRIAGEFLVGLHLDLRCFFLSTRVTMMDITRTRSLLHSFREQTINNIQFFWPSLLHLIGVDEFFFFFFNSWVFRWWVVTLCVSLQMLTILWFKIANLHLSFLIFWYQYSFLIDSWCSSWKIINLGKLSMFNVTHVTYIVMLLVLNYFLSATDV